MHEHAKDLIEQIQKNKEEFCKYKTRLAYIRSDVYIKQMQLRNEIRFDNEPDTAKGFSDLISETNSIAGSTMTRTSQASKSSGYFDKNCISTFSNYYFFHFQLFFYLN